MVQSTKLQGQQLEIHLKENVDSQELLRALMERVRVRSFAEKVPSLHEIYIHLVGQSDA